MIIEGSCHCGNISFQLDWGDETGVIPARACTCTFCQKHGGVWTSSPTGSVEVSIRERDAYSRYAFGSKTADFHVCSRCGVVPVVTSEIDGRLYAVVSVAAMQGVDPRRLQRAPASFDGEQTAERLARRAKGWIPDVHIRIDA
jgi:hypothetical protein